MHQKDYVSPPFKKGNYYYYYTYIHNKRVFRSTGMKTRSAAQAMILDRVRCGDILNQEVRKKYKTLSEYAQDFWIYEECPLIRDELARGGHYTKAFAKTNHNRTRLYILPYFKGRFFDEITPSMVQNWLYWLRDKKDLAPSTCNAIMSILRSLFQYAIKEGLTASNPTADIKPLKGKQKKPRGCFTIDEVRKLFSIPWENCHVKVMCMIAATTGMRQGEILALSPKQIHDGYLEVDRSWSKGGDKLKTTKSGNARIVPISAYVQRQLEALPRQEFLFSYNGVQPFDGKGILRNLKRQMELVGIDYKRKNLTFHSFRHFFNTQLVGASITGEKIRAVVGHESMEMSLHYLHAEAADMGDIRQIQDGILGFNGAEKKSLPSE